MRADKKLNSWNNIIEMSDVMKRSAANDEWQAVAELAVQRHRAVTTHFTNYPVNPENAHFYYRHLNSFMTEEQKLQAMATTARKKVMHDGTAMQQNRKAIGAYQENR